MKILEILSEMRDRRDAYQRDYDSSVSGMGKRDSLAYQLDGGANDEGWDKEEWKPRPRQSYKVPHDVYIDGRKWKTFDSHDHASNVARKLQSNGKKATVHRTLEENSDAPITAVNVAVGPVYKNKPAKQPKNKDGTAKNALDMKGTNLLTGGSIKR
jgi:hypothetical protein